MERDRGGDGEGWRGMLGEVERVNGEEGEGKWMLREPSDKETASKERG